MLTLNTSDKESNLLLFSLRRKLQKLRTWIQFCENNTVNLRLRLLLWITILLYWKHYIFHCQSRLNINLWVWKKQNAFEDIITLFCVIWRQFGRRIWKLSWLILSTVTICIKIWKQRNQIFILQIVAAGFIWYWSRFSYTNFGKI